MERTAPIGPLTLLMLSTLALSCRKPPPGPLPPGRAADVVVDGCALHATLTPSVTSIRAGERISAMFRVTSDCDKELQRLSVGDNESKYGRSEGFSVSAETLDHNGSAQHKAPGEMFGGGTGRVPLSRAHPWEKQLQLDDYLEWTVPDRYEVVVIARPMIGGETPKLEVSTFIDVAE